jgi:2-C-methyl-D-erythritol 4-phosphate cytidylyltransferase
LKKFAIIVAGGAGTRMNAEIPKQFLLLKGRPVLMHSVETFQLAYPGITTLIVLPKLYWEVWKTLCKEYKFDVHYALAEGGETRFNSVKNGLELITEDGIVAIHDAARPLVSEKLIISSMEYAEKHGNAIPAINFSESMRIIEGDRTQVVNRDNYRIIQTPQCFRLSQLKSAYRQGYTPGFTDDAAVLESTGVQINLIEGEKTNLKITLPEDLIMAEALFSK